MNKKHGATRLIKRDIGRGVKKKLPLKRLAEMEQKIQQMQMRYAELEALNVNLEKRLEDALQRNGDISKQMLDGDGNYANVLAMITDVNIRKQVEVELHRAEKKYRTVADSTYDWVMWEAPDGRFLYVSPSCERFSGYQAHDFMENPGLFMEIILPEDRAVFLQSQEEVKNTLEARVVDFRINHKNGSVVDLEYAGYPMVNEQGEFLGVRYSSRDVTARKLAEDTLRDSEARYRRLVEGAPDIVYTNSLQRGGIFYSSQVENVLGYTAEYLYKNPMLWRMSIHPDDQPRVNNFFDQIFAGEPFDLEYRIRDVHGNWVWIRDRSIGFYLDEGDVLIEGLATNITARKRAEHILQARMRLAEFSISHSLHELLQATLNETEKITESLIGFFHFIEDDQNTISLQNWSTRTLDEFCHAEGAGLHYPMEKAGIWADCARQRKPIIFNDYASVPFQKGLPAGHAEVKRILTVPLIRGEKVVAIFGVGNKSVDYTEYDLRVVSFLADLAWDIAERKIAEEKLKETNKLLEEQLGEIRILQNHLRELATRDALTGLHNRHYLHENMGREAARALREGSVVSVIMIDIDNFKKLNDTYGHQAGDEVLAALGNLLVGMVRQGDIACRYGGEEFIILMTGARVHDVENRANAIRHAFGSMRIQFAGLELSTTISVGIGFFPEHGSTINEVIKAADAALYEAKQAGRNCVKVCRVGIVGF